VHTERTLGTWPWAKRFEGILLLAAVPFLLFPTQYILATALALILVVGLWLWPLFFLRSPLIPPTPYNAALFLFCCTVLVAILVTADPEESLPKAAGIILGLSAWRYITVYMQRRSLFFWAVAGYIILGLAMTAFGFLNANWLLKTTSQVPYLQGLETIIPGGPIALAGAQSGIHPNQTAGLITLYLPLMLSLLVGSLELRRHKILLLFVALLTFLSGFILLLTQSRSGWLGIVSGIFTLLILWGINFPPSRKRRVIWAITIILLLIGTILIVQWGPVRIMELWLSPPQETAVGSLSTLNFRQEIWPWALTAVRDFPYTGTGLGAFRVVAGRLYPLNVPDTFDFAHAHNVFLQLALDFGIPGLVSYGALLILSILLGWQISRRDSQLRPVSIGILASLCAFHVYGLADTLAIGSKPALLLWVVFALLATANHISHSKAQ
jgi:putative inorganic carbon (hco3(-)) transporter